MSSYGLSAPAGEPYFVPEKLWAADTAPVRVKEKVPPLIDRDGINIFVMIAPLLFIVQLGTYSALLFTLSVLTLAFRHRGSVRAVFHNYGFFLLFPAFAMLSSFWSVAPSETLKHSGELVLTVFGALLLAQVRNRRSMMFVLFAAFALYALASLAFGNVVAVGTNGTTAVSGLADSKNEQASTVAIGAIISLAWFFIGLNTRRYLQCVLAIPILALELYSAVLAKSAGALAALAVGLMFFLVLAALSKLGRRFRVAVVGFGGTIIFGTAIIFMIFTGPIVETISGWFGKDATLTGRTYLWARARDLIVEHPLVGRGFSAFWQQGNLDAEGLWRFAHIASRSGFNFHNTSNDILVSLGWMGLILFVMTLVTGLVKLAAAYVKRPSMLAAFWLSLGASFVVRLPVESMGFYEFSFATVLLFSIFGYAATARDLNARASQYGYVPGAGSLAPAAPYAL